MVDIIDHPGHPAQRTQGIGSFTWVISPAKKNATCIGSTIS